MKEIKIISSGNELEDSDFVYNYIPEITKKIDNYDGDFNERILHEIVLWKVNRYPLISGETLAQLNKIKKSDESFDEEFLRGLLSELLKCRGVKLPMASTFLRFKNPNLFQIIDQHVYRLITGEQLNLPYPSNDKNRKELCTIYFDYLKILRQKCEELRIDFRNSDRLLFNADKRINKGVKLRNYGS